MFSLFQQQIDYDNCGSPAAKLSEPLFRKTHLEQTLLTDTLVH